MWLGEWLRTGCEGRWTFVGQLTNPGDTLWAFATDNLKEENVVVRKNGAFRFTTELAEAKEYYFLTPSLIRGEGGYSFLVTAVPGEVLQAEGFCDKGKPADGLTYSGTSFYQYYTEAIIAGRQVAAGCRPTSTSRWPTQRHIGSRRKKRK